MKKLLTTFSAITLTVCLIGCNEQTKANNKVLNDLTPNMNGLAETYAQNDAGVAVVNNAGDRMFVDDLRRATLLDKPSMLTPYPVVQD